MTPDERAQLDRLASDTLRADLHAGIDAIMDRHARDPRDQGTLKHEIDAVTHGIVDEHPSGASLLSRSVDEVQRRWEGAGVPFVSATSTSIEAATAKLREALQTAYGHSKPGVKATVKQFSRVVPIIAGVLYSVLDDEAQLRELQKRAESMLVGQLQMKPGTAHAVTETALKVAKTLPRPKEKGDQTQDSDNVS